jgi:hypothetical protein
MNVAAVTERDVQALTEDVARLREQLVDRLALLEAKTRQALERPEGLAGESREVAHEILRLIPIARDKARDGQDSALEVAQIRELHSRITRLVTVPLVKHAIRLRQGGKRGRKLAFRQVLEAVVAKGIRDLDAVFNELEILASTHEHPVIGAVLKRRTAAACRRLRCAEDYHVHWRTAPGRGLRTIGFKTIRNTISRIAHS